MARVSNALLTLLRLFAFSHVGSQTYTLLTGGCHESSTTDLNITVDGVQYRLPQVICQQCSDTCMQLYQIIQSVNWKRGCVRVNPTEEVDPNASR